MKKELKDTIIVELGEKLKEYPHFYLVDLTGLNAEKTSELRRNCFKNDIRLLVVKNKLLHKAFENAEPPVYLPLPLEYDQIRLESHGVFHQHHSW